MVREGARQNVYRRQMRHPDIRATDGVNARSKVPIRPTLSKCRDTTMSFVPKLINYSNKI